jgi:signal peptidase II
MLIVLLAVGVAVLDQATKEWVLRAFALGESVPVIPGFFHLTYVRNTGAAWGLMSGSNHWLVVFSVVMLVLLVVFRHAFHGGRGIHRVGLGLLLGGIAGNLFDRMRYGYVVDFLDFHLGGRHFPAFNVADAAITLGVGIYLLGAAWEERRARRASPDATRKEGDAPPASA